MEYDAKKIILNGFKILDPYQNQQIDDKFYKIEIENKKISSVSFLNEKQQQQQQQQSDQESESDINSGDKNIIIIQNSQKDPNLIICPQLYDSHTHVYEYGTSLGVDPVKIAKKSGTTVFIDAGSAGAGNIEGLYYHIQQKVKPLQIYAFINISFAGIYAFCQSFRVGECHQLELLNIDECVKACLKFPEFIIGIKVRIGSLYGKGLEPIKIALQAAEKVQHARNINHFPVMCHIDHPPPSRKEILLMLRPGDILTHAFRPLPLQNSSEQNHEIIEAMLEAHSRGIHWDIGHGGGSFSFQVARQWLQLNQLPDFISSDVHILSINGPAYDNLHVMNKFLNLGMPLYEVIKSVTLNPYQHLLKNNKSNSQTIQLQGIKTGNTANLVILKLSYGEFEFEDCTAEGKSGQRGEIIKATQKLEVNTIILDGEIYGMEE